MTIYEQNQFNFILSMWILEKINLYFKSTAESEIKWFSDVFLMYEKEQKIFKQTRIYLNWDKLNNRLIHDFEYDLYNFQLTIELLERYADEIWIDKKQRELLLEWLDALSLANRFLMIGHYNVVGKYLRNMLESNINAVHWYLKNKYRHNDWGKKITEIQQKAPNELSIINNQEDRQTNNDFPKETAKLYDYLCSYVHNSALVEILEYSEKQITKHILLIMITMYFVGRILLLWFNDKIPSYLYNTVRKPVRWEWKEYKTYVRNLMNDTWFFETVKPAYREKYGLDDLHFDIEKLFPKWYYLE